MILFYNVIMTQKKKLEIHLLNSLKTEKKTQRLFSKEISVSGAIFWLIIPWWAVDKPDTHTHQQHLHTTTNKDLGEDKDRAILFCHGGELIRKEK